MDIPLSAVIPGTPPPAARQRQHTFDATDAQDREFLRAWENVETYAHEDRTWAVDEERRGSTLTLVEVLRGEKAFLDERTERLREAHVEEPSLLKLPIGVALSGGGVRAAAFHCGLLWQLASAGLMKDVIQLSAVSGGGYAAACLVTYLVSGAHSSPPREASSLDRWYQERTAEAILRMQHNLAFFLNVNSSRKFSLPDKRRHEEAGNSLFPRICDLPLFIGSLVIAILATPCLIAINATMPVVLCIEQSVGALLREAWCDPVIRSARTEDMVSWFYSRSYIVGSFVGTAALLALCSGLGCCRKRAPNYSGYLFRRSTQQILARGAVLYSFYICLVYVVLQMQMFSWGSDGHKSIYVNSSATGDAWARHYCWLYVNRTLELSSDPSCDNRIRRESGTSWFLKPSTMQTYGNWSWVVQHDVEKRPSGFDPAHSNSYVTPLLLSITGTIALVGLLGLLFDLPIMKWFLTLAGPLWAVFLIALVAQWRIFGPVTGQSLSPGESLRYTQARGQNVFHLCTVGAVFTMPVYDILQKVTHFVYRRSIQLAFFNSGQDQNYAKSVHCPYCPNLVLGACLMDYRHPQHEESEDPITDFELTPLFLGCLRTGFFPMDRQAKLGYMTAISGAAPDTFMIQKFDVVPTRFLLSVLALRLGDFVRVDPYGPTAARVGSEVRRFREGHPRWRWRFGQNSPLLNSDTTEDSSAVMGRKAQRGCQMFLDRVVVAGPFIACHLLLLVGQALGDAGGLGAQCSFYSWTVQIAFGGFICLFALSFYAFAPQLRWMLRSPVILQFQMMFMHRHQAVRPPPYLYLSDGGLIECLGVLPLLRRRMRLIICSDACEDPDASLRALYDTMVLALKERLCSFYDLEDPSRDINLRFLELKDSPMPYLRVGIRYEPNQPCDGAGLATGELLYIRMRILPGDQASVRPPLTASELLLPPQTPAGSAFHTDDDADEPGRTSAKPPAAMHMARTESSLVENMDRSLLSMTENRLRSEMDGSCCNCRCCALCKAGRRFPDFSKGNQCLQPEHFANLAILGAEMSRPAVRRLRLYRDDAATQHPP